MNVLYQPLGSEIDVLGRRLGNAANTRPEERPFLNTGYLIVGGTTDVLLTDGGDKLTFAQPN